MGRHNGHEAYSYTPLIDLDPPLAGRVLDLFSESGIAAYVTPALHRSNGTPQPVMDRPLDRVYVDANALVRASTLLRERLPALRREHEASGRNTLPKHADTNVIVEDSAWASVLASYSMPSEQLTGSWPEQEDLPAEEKRPARPQRRPNKPGGPRTGRVLRPVEGGTAGDGSPLPEWAWEDTDAVSDHNNADHNDDRDDSTTADDSFSPSDPRNWTPAQEPEEHYVPPAPPPLPRTDPLTKVGWVGLLGGPLLLLATAMLGKEFNGWLGGAGIVMFIGGFLILVAHMRDSDPVEDDPDDGAVV